MPIEQQRLALIGNLHQVFDLTEREATEWAEALKCGGPLHRAMHWEIMVGHSQLKSPHAQLSDELRDHLLRCGAGTRWAELLASKIRPQWKYIHYILRDGETYGGFAVAKKAP